MIKPQIEIEKEANEYVKNHRKKKYFYDYYTNINKFNYTFVTIL